MTAARPFVRLDLTDTSIQPVMTAPSSTTEQASANNNSSRPSVVPSHVATSDATGSTRNAGHGAICFLSSHFSAGIPAAL